jgi:hypothetical protein
MILQFYDRWFCIFLLLLIQPAWGQQSTLQGWTEAMATHSLNEKLSIENAVTYSTLYGQPKWRALDYSLCVERNFKNKLDIIGQGVISYTIQNDTYNTLELRPVIGLRWYFIQSNTRRLHLRMLFRLENRNLKNLTDNYWESSIRPRLRTEMLIPLNKRRLNEQNVWYGMFDIEFLFYNNNINERFANKNRTRMGLGYRLNECWRFEGIVMWQQSRDNIGEPFDQNDFIFRLRVRYNFPSSKNISHEGMGN